MDIKERILVALGLNKSENEIQLGFQAKGEDGTIFVSTAEELESGVDISVLTEDGTTIPLPIGTYKLDTGVTFRVEEEGIVSEVIESETEEEVESEDDEKEEMAKKKDDKDEEDEEDDMKKEEDKYEDESPAEKADWAESYEKLKDKVDNLEDAIADIKSMMGEGESEDVEMTEEVVKPSTNPKTIKTTEVVEFSAEDEIKKLKKENDKLKTELASSPADAPINTNKFSSERKELSRKEYNKLSKQERFIYNLNK